MQSKSMKPYNLRRIEWLLDGWRTTCDEAVNLVSAKTGVAVSRMRSPERTMNVAWARSIAIWLCVRSSVHPSEIADYFSRDRSSISAAVRRINSACTISRKLAESLTELGSKMTNPRECAANGPRTRRHLLDGRGHHRQASDAS